MPSAPSVATVTSVAGPGIAVTAQVFNNVTDIDFQLGRNMLQLKNNDQWVQVSLTPVTTVTFSIAASVATVVVS